MVVSAIDLLRCDIGFKMGQTKYLYVYFRSFKQQFCRKMANFSGIRTQIRQLEGKHTDHLIPTMAAMFPLIILSSSCFLCLSKRIKMAQLCFVAKTCLIKIHSSLFKGL